MNGINATPSSLVFTPVPGQATAADDPPSIKQTGHTVLEQIPAQPPAGATAAQVQLAAPEPGALAPATVATSVQNLSSVQAPEIAFDFNSCRSMVQQLVMKNAQEARNAGRAERESQTQAQVKSMRAEAQEMRNAAESTFKGAIVQGAFQIAGGAMQAGFSAASAAQSIKGINQEAAGRVQLNDAKVRSEGMTIADQKTMRMDGLEQMTGAKLLNASAMKNQGFAQAGSGLAAGMGGILGGSFTLEAGEAEARRTENAAKTKVTETAIQESNEFMQQAQELANAVKDMTRSMDQSIASTNSKILS